jgi:hypothetical protein
VRLVHAWFDGGTELAIGMDPPMRSLLGAGAAFVAQGSDTIAMPAARAHLGADLLAIPMERRTATVKSTLAAINGVLELSPTLEVSGNAYGPLSWSWTMERVNVFTGAPPGHIECSVRVARWLELMPNLAGRDVHLWETSDLIAATMALANQVLRMAGHGA